ncbi:Serine/threonine protein kinase [Abditibacterium utsteinense]|uniref:Serine/threonine protein kinase n=1 Tax=Abditibacterium utsteinense TaxID=1960156 RepID=A0A2S8SXB7_9BACT|nr:PASTA domain-containing protein [Abditibacterium utsteinense]PQV65445.1 Serine/threonine protein kinase [Abditibacterium utsteinense]
MLATGRNDRSGAQGRGKNGRNSISGAGSRGAGSRFEVLGRAGEGTLWIVYRVKERATGQVWALKALKGAFNRHPRFPAALLSCCEKWCGLDHPHIDSPREIGQEDGTLFFTSQWLSGGSLEMRLVRALSRDEILKVLGACADALAWLHERDLTHGDLRPRQLLFDAAGQLKLSDAGIAGAFAAAGLALADVQPDAAWYLAPERTQGAALAPPADLYALGVVLYRMLAGRVPFDGPSPLSIALRHRSDTPLPPSHFNPRCPADLEAIALLLLEKDAARRISAAALLQKLQTLDSAAGEAIIAPGASAISAPLPVSSPVAALVDEEVSDVAPRQVLSPVVTVAAAAVPAVAALQDDIVLDRETLRKRHKRRELWGALSALLCLFLAIGAFGGMFYGAYYEWVKALPREVRVPEYIGLGKDDAIQKLAKAGLTLRVGRETYDAKKPEGTVVSGVPESGRRVRAHREVTVTISQGEAPVTMYDFSELPLDKARQIISQHAMRLGPVVEQFHDSVPRGSICGQYPEADTPFRRSEPITLIVSRGKQPTEIDATKGELPPEDSAPVISDPSAASPNVPVPFEETPRGNPSGANTPGTSVTQAALIRVQTPADSGPQLVRLIVRDDDGERVVYSKTQPAGAKISQRVRVRHARGAKSVVRVYVGDSLIKSEEF